MSPRQWQFFIEDIINAIEKIQQYSAGMERSAFRTDGKTQDAIERKLIVIGEAASHIPSNIVQKYSSIPWREMRDMRNFAVHAYWGVKPEVVWDTVQRDLPSLLPMLRQIFQDEVKEQ